MGILSNIFSSKNSETLVDGIYNGLDMTFYTDEEKADMVIKQAEMKLKLLPLFAPFKLTQRYIAILFTVNFIISFWVGIGLFMWMPTYLDGFMKIVGIFELGWIMLSIIAWYFGGAIVSSYTGKDSNNK